MKAISIILVFLLALTTQSQEVTNGEYFFNNDPGFNNGTEFTVTEVDGSFSKEINISTTNLSNGFNNLYVRVQQDNTWSMYDNALFYIVNSDTYVAPLTLKNIVSAEYFFDNDPIPGNGTSIDITESTIINPTFTVDVSNLEQGFHTIYIRCQSEDQQWSMYDTSLFYISNINENNLTETSITNVEYFIDTDPGVGSGNAVTLDTSGSEVNQVFTISTTNIDPGFHTVYVRAKNANNEWSMYDATLFYISSAYKTSETSTIVKAEYFFNEFVENGEGTDITLATNDDGNFETEIATDGLEEGEHTLFIRVQNEAGVWSLYDLTTFTIDNTLSVTDFSEKNLSISPNPSVDIININTNQNIESYTLYDLNGKTVQNGDLKNEKINIQHLTSGVYFVIIKTDTGYISNKIIKK